MTSRLLPEELDSYPVVDGAYLLDAGPSARGWHRAATSLTCPQLLAYTDELHLNLPEAGVLVRGSLIHLGLAHYFRRLQAVQDGDDPNRFLGPAKAIRVFAERQDARPTSLFRERGVASKHPASIPYARHVDTALASVEAMHRWFRADHWRVRAVERQVHADVPLHDGTTQLFSQRLDLVLEDRAGTVYICDHKCVPASTRVETWEGERTIGDLLAAGKPWRACAWDGTKLAWSEASVPTFAGVQPVFRVTTADGKAEKYGHTHPILTQRGWVAAEKLRAGDRVASAVCLPDRQEADVSDAWLRAIGLLICDGALTSGDLTFTKTDARKRQVLREALGAEGFVVTERQGTRRVPLLSVKRPAQVRARLAALGVPLVKSPERYLPSWGLSRRQAGILLGALWMGDGHAQVAQNGHPRLCFSGRSERLIRDVQRLLAHLHIFSSVTRSSVLYRGERRPTWTVTVAGREAKQRFLYAVDVGDIDLAGTLDTSPLWAALPPQGSTCPRRNPRLDGALHWSSVKAVEELPPEPCYDVTVPGPATFVAGGLVTHNTRGRKDARTERAYARSGQFQGFQVFGWDLWGERWGGSYIFFVTLGAKGVSIERVAPPAYPNRVFDFPATIRWAEHVQSEAKRLHPDPWHRPKVGLDNGACEHRFGPCPAAALCDHGKAQLDAWASVKDEQEG